MPAAAKRMLLDFLAEPPDVIRSAIYVLPWIMFLVTQAASCKSTPSGPGVLLRRPQFILFYFLFVSWVQFFGGCTTGSGKAAGPQ
jgi:hypothetical protein